MSAKHDNLFRMSSIEDILRSSTPLLMEALSLAQGSDPRRHEILGTRGESLGASPAHRFGLLVEDHIVAQLARAFPGERVLGEEDVRASGRFWERLACSDRFWLVDPIDGTTSMSRGYPAFCTTAAFLARKAGGGFEVLAGATWDPVRQEMFSAARGCGARVNQRRLQVTRVREPRESLISTGFALAPKRVDPGQLEAFGRVLQQSLGVRCVGVAALDLAYVAAGRVEAYYDRGLDAWSSAAGSLMVTEAGGRITRPDGGEWDPIVSSEEILASNGLVHGWLQDVTASPAEPPRSRPRPHAHEHAHLGDKERLRG